MTKDGLLIGVTTSGVRVTPLALIHTPTLTRVIGQCVSYSPGMWRKSLHFESQTKPLQQSKPLHRNLTEILKQSVAERGREQD